MWASQLKSERGERPPWNWLYWWDKSCFSFPCWAVDITFSGSHILIIWKDLTKEVYLSLQTTSPTSSSRRRLEMCERADEILQRVPTSALPASVNFADRGSLTVSLGNLWMLPVKERQCLNSYHDREHLKNQKWSVNCTANPKSLPFLFSHSPAWKHPWRWCFFLCKKGKSINYRLLSFLPQHT